MADGSSESGAHCIPYIAAALEEGGVALIGVACAALIIMRCTSVRLLSAMAVRLSLAMVIGASDKLSSLSFFNYFAIFDWWQRATFYRWWLSCLIGIGMLAIYSSGGSGGAENSGKLAYALLRCT